MVNIAKENLCINKLVAEKKDIIFVEGDMIVPDSKPDILKQIGTSGIVCIYKKELQEGRVRIDGNINTYIMYLPDGASDTVRGLNTSLDFSEMIDVQNVAPDMQVILNHKIKSIECKVINGRKIGIKAAIEIYLKVFKNEEIDIVNDVQDASDVQMLKRNLSVNSLVGTGMTKIYAKDTLQIDNIDLLAEILNTNLNIIGKDIKVSYNKVLTKAEAEIKIVYLTEDNRVNHITYKIPTVGFIDIQNVNENNICDVNYEVKNIIIKPNNQEEHSIYVEIELEVNCNVYEEKQINLIQDLYSPTNELNLSRKQVLTITNKMKRKKTKQIREKVTLNNIEDKSLIDVNITSQFMKEEKINSKVLYEGELELEFMFLSRDAKIQIENAKIPFDYVIDNIQNGELLNISNDIEIVNQDFIIKDLGEITVNVDLVIISDMYMTANMNLIDNIEEVGEREEQDYSLIIYIVKKDDSLWKIAKKFGSTVDDISRVNGIEESDVIYPGQKLFIPKLVKETTVSV